MFRIGYDVRLRPVANGKADCYFVLLGERMRCPQALVRLEFGRSAFLGVIIRAILALMASGLDGEHSGTHGIRKT